MIEIGSNLLSAIVVLSFVAIFFGVSYFIGRRERR